MGRKREEKEPIILENISEKCFKAIGLEVPREKSNLFARIFLSGISHYFFFSPDDIIKMGFLKIEKSPEKNELFKVTIQKNLEAGVVNAETLWKYYTGELIQETKFKEIIQNFMEELISYSQTQEESITKLTNNLQRKKRRN